jgi:hypothetical protein
MIIMQRFETEPELILFMNRQNWYIEKIQFFWNNWFLKFIKEISVMHMHCYQINLCKSENLK